jgi:hypothetical protein
MKKREKRLVQASSLLLPRKSLKQFFLLQKRKKGKRKKQGNYSLTNITPLTSARRGKYKKNK